MGKLKLLPSEVALLFFVLCSRHGLQEIRAPAVALSDGRHELATYRPSMGHAITTRVNGKDVGGAVVLCCAMRSSVDWKIVQCGSCCEGYIVPCRRVVTRRLYTPI